MVWPRPIIQHTQSITRQAAARLFISLGLFVVLVGLTTTLLYQTTMSKAAHERAENMAQFFRSRFDQQERDWELRIRDTRARIEYTRLLENPETAVVNLQAFMTIQGGDRRFQYLHIDDRHGQKIFSYGKDLDLAAIPVSHDVHNGYYFDPVNKDIYRVFLEHIWLGERGMGHLAIFYRIDNALLQQLAAPGVTLTAIHEGTPVASSEGARGINEFESSTTLSSSTELKTVPWTLGSNSLLTVAIAAPVKPLFTKTELAFAAAIIPIIDALILWLILGTWLMRQANRINNLGEAVREFSTEHGYTLQLHKKIHTAKAEAHDEIHSVADTIEAMAKMSEIRELELKQMEDQRRLWGMVFANINEAILITNAKNRIITVNPTFAQLTGYSEEEIIGQNPSILASGAEREGFYEEMWQQINDKGHWEGEIHDRRKDGSVYPKWLTVVAVKDSQGRPINYVGTFVDITERKKHEARILHLATHDALTGLPNRSLLLEHVAKGIAQASRNNTMLAILFLDLDRFKGINDSLGHEYGDRLLKLIARRLLDTMRSSDTIARIGGDEFVILLNDVKEVSDVSAAASKVIEQISHPVTFNGREFHITTSLGISIYPNDGNTADQLLKHADAAMYSAKAAGKNQARFFDIQMNQSAMERFEIENGLREALASQQLHLAFQPKQCLHRTVCGGAEALLRWNHPALGAISPARFIPIAEETGLITAIGEWVLRHTFQQIRTWREANIDPGIIAVNISAQQIEAPNFIDMVIQLISEFRIEPDSLEFELTESAILQNPQQAIATLEHLRLLGIRLSLDDFGTGYSSLSYLKKLPVDTVKIDRSFINGLPYDEDDAQIVRMTVAMAKSIGLIVVAEGVESAEQLGYLKDVGCDLVQGFFIAKPMPSEQYENWLKEFGFTACADRSVCGQKRCTPIQSVT